MKKIYNKPQMQIVVIKMESLMTLSGPQLVDPGTSAKITADDDGDVMETSRRNDYWDDDIW